MQERADEAYRAACERFSEEQRAAANEQARLGREVQVLRDALAAAHAGQDAELHRMKAMHSQVASSELERRALESALREARAEAESARKAQGALRQVLALQQQQQLRQTGDISAGSVASVHPVATDSKSTLRSATRGARSAAATLPERTAPLPETRGAPSRAVNTAVQQHSEDHVLSPGSAALQSALRKARARREGSVSSTAYSGGQGLAHPAAAAGAPASLKDQGEPTTKQHVQGNDEENIDSAIAGLLEQLLSSGSADPDSAASSALTAVPSPGASSTAPRLPATTGSTAIQGGRSLDAPASSASPSQQFTKFMAAPIPKPYTKAVPRNSVSKVSQGGSAVLPYSVNLVAVPLPSTAPAPAASSPTPSPPSVPTVSAILPVHPVAPADAIAFVKPTASGSEVAQSISGPVPSGDVPLSEIPASLSAPQYIPNFAPIVCLN